MNLIQCARFYNNPCLVHECAVRRIEKYLASTSTYVNSLDDNRWLTKQGVVYSHNTEKYIGCYVEADFASGWAKSDADNEENFMSRMGYVITYAGCPVFWCSELLHYTRLWSSLSVCVCR